MATRSRDSSAGEAPGNRRFPATQSLAARPIPLGDLAAELGRPIEGDADLWIEGVASLDSAGPCDLSFVRSIEFAPRLAATRAAAVIAPPGVEVLGRAAIRSPNPSLDFSRATLKIIPEKYPQAGIHPMASVADDAIVDVTASIGPGCVIGEGSVVGPHSVLTANVTLYLEVSVGADCVIHAGCVLRERTVVGDRVVLHPGVVLGADGFGYIANAEGGLEKTPQVGRVVVEEDVEIGANSTIDRGSLGNTTIGRGTKIDNLVQIAHNCVIGEQVIIIGQAGLSGSTVVERGVIIMAQAGVVGHLTIGEGAFVGPQSGIHKDVAPRTRVLGSPQREDRNFHKQMAALVRLPDLIKRIRAIEKRLGLRGREPAPLAKRLGTEGSPRHGRELRDRPRDPSHR